MEPILTCEGLTKQYGSMPALSNASFNIYAGRIIGLLTAAERPLS